MPDRVIECGEKAVENAPNNVTVMIDLAMSLLRFRRDAARVRPLLERVREHEISDLILPFLTAAEGVLASKRKSPSRPAGFSRTRSGSSTRFATPRR